MEEEKERKESKLGRKGGRKKGGRGGKGWMEGRRVGGKEAYKTFREREGSSGFN